MKVKSALLKEIKYSKTNKEEIIIALKVNNGFNNIDMFFSKENLSYEDMVKHEVKVQGIFFQRNCCRATPVTILDSEKKEDQKDVILVIDQILELVGEEIQQKLQQLKK